MEKKKGFLLVGIATLTWGFLPVALKPIATVVNADFLVFIRFLGASILMLPFAIIFFRKQEPIVWQRIFKFKWYVLLLILLGFLIPQVFFTWVIGNRSVGIVAFIIYAYPVFSVIFALLILGEKGRKSLVIAILFFGAGLYMMLTQGQHHVSTNIRSVGLLLAPLVISICWGASTVLSKYLMNKGIPSMMVAYLRVFGGTLVLFLLLLGSNRLDFGQMKELSGVQWAGLLYAIIVPIAIGLPLYLAGLRRIRVVWAAFIEATTPVTTAMWAMLLLNESLLTGQLVGGGLMVASSIMVALFGTREVRCE